MSEVQTHLAGVRRAIEYVRSLQADGSEFDCELFVMFMPLAMQFGFVFDRPDPQLVYFIVPRDPAAPALYHSGSDVLSSGWIGDVK